MKKLILVFLALALVPFSAPKKVEALAVCSATNIPGIQFSSPFGDLGGSGRIIIPQGTTLSFNVKTFAEPSSFNEIIYPDRRTIYVGPSSAGRQYTTTRAIDSTSFIEVNLTQNCEECPTYGGEPCTTPVDPPDATYIIELYVEPAQSGNISVQSNLASGGWSISGPSSISGSGPTGNYTDLQVGSYTLTPNSVSGYTVVVDSATQNLSNGSTITFNLTYTATGGGPGEPGEPPGEPGEPEIPAGGTCGNGIREGSEQCDNGGLNGACPSTCSASCTTNSCPLPPEYCASVVGQSVPASTPASLPFAASVTMRNCGSRIWIPNDFKLGSQSPQDTMRWGLNRVELVAPVPGGHDHTFSFNPVAPAATGTASWAWRMVHEYVRWFGDTASANIDITTGPVTRPAVTLPGGGACTVNPTYTANFSWTGDTVLPEGYYVDISTDPTFSTFYNKNVSGHSTDSSGFVLFGGTDTLTLQPDSTYYVRAYNGVAHSPTANYTISYCRKRACGVSGNSAVCTSIIGTGPDECSLSTDCPPPPPSCVLTATPPRIVIPPPASVRLDWSCDPGNPPTGCTLTGFGTVNSGGQEVIFPTSSQTYILNCGNAGGEATSTVIIRTFNIASGTIKEIPPPTNP